MVVDVSVSVGYAGVVGLTVIGGGSTLDVGIFTSAYSAFLIVDLAYFAVLLD